MKRSTYLLIVAILSFAFGLLNFFAPTFGSELFGLVHHVDTMAVLRGMGSLLIGSAILNLLLRHTTDAKAMKALLLSNIITHVMGLLADVWGVNDGALTLANIIPVELSHLFAVVGSGFYLMGMKTD